MALLRFAALSAIAYGLYRALSGKADRGRAAFATGESTPGPVEVRNAGPAAMASNPPEWDNIDQASDESFPASDPPSANRFN